MRKISKIVVHCSYTPASMDIGAETIRDWHVNDNGWDDIGYHYVITRDGSVEKGRALGTPGAHVRGHNEDSIGICLIGGMTEDKEHTDSNFTRWQWGALDALLSDLEGRFGKLDVVGHRDLDASKDCPCFDVQAWVANP